MFLTNDLIVQVGPDLVPEHEKQKETTTATKTTTTDEYSNYSQEAITTPKN